jgi:DNA-binding NarL/FixJ family response regulator
MHSESLFAQRALRAGASGYITKEQATDRIIEAIRHVLAGKIYLSEAMTEDMVRQVAGEKPGDVGRSAVETLSDRELQVFRQIGHGARTQDIAKSLHLSVKTIETYRVRIRDKLGLKKVADLAHHAIQWALEND